MVGWHVELYVDSRELASLSPVLAALPCVSIDHLGLAKEGFASLCKAVQQLQPELFLLQRSMAGM